MTRRIGMTLSALALALVPLLTSASAGTAAPAEVRQLEDAISVLVEAEAYHGGRGAAAFPHWNAGRDATDGCSTRQEVLLAEAVDEPSVGPGCSLSGGRWVSYYDNQSVTKPASVTVDHVVPLAEAWGSGASEWTTARREAYANDQDAPATLAAVTVRSQKEKDGQDITDWLPPEAGAICRYLGDWVGTKLRWGLTADKAELETLKLFADNSCETTVVIYHPAPQV
ncbi:HNH endonuclease [Streptomyces sp. NPDC001985]|uniref:HNH endonuclease n=1 Tax=Streptomyces sp. NPDC001985 TaxID=3154406 RepID=UPI003331B348